MSKQLSNVDFNRNQILNRVIQQLATAPSTPQAGLEYFDTALGAPYVHNGSGWVCLDATKLSGVIPNTALTTNPLARANHTGTQISATISDLATTVKAYTLDTFAAPLANVAMNGFTLTGLNTGPSASGQAAEYSWVVSQIQASAAGIDSKPSCVVVGTTNQATLTGLLTIDGVTLIAGQRVLLVAQTTASQNGPWIAGTGAWTRPVGESVTPQAFYFIEQGTVGASSQWKVSTTGTITLGTTSITITQWGAGTSYTAGNGLQLVGNVFSVLLPASSGLTTSGSGVAIDTTIVARKFSVTIGDGSTAAIQVTHNLGTVDCIVQVRDVTTNAVVGVDITNNTTNTSTITFAVAPAINSYRVTCIA